MNALQVGTVRPQGEGGARAFWRSARVWLVLALLVGAALRIATYLGNRSLHLDEARLALNIIERSPQQLLDPLDYGQAAPIGFLIVEKLLVSGLGEAEWVLRLTPLLAGLASLALTPLVSRRWLCATETALATWLVALSQPLVYYSSEVKQYSSDIFLGLLVVWATQRALSRERAGMTCLALLGVLALCCSQPAVFVCVASASTLALWAWNAPGRATSLRVAAVACVWGACVAALYASLLRPSPTTVSLRALWWRSFPPLPPRALSDLAWPVRSFFGFFNDPAGLGATGVASVAFVLGCGALLRAKREALALCLLPVLATLGAATLHVYPFATALSTESYPLPGRVLLFLVPGVAIVVASGLGWLLRERVRLGWVVGGLMLASMAGELAVRPAWSIRVHDLRPLVETLARYARPRDWLVLNSRSLPTFRYYLRRFREPLAATLDRPVIELKGTCDWRAYERQVRALGSGARPARVWLLYAHHPSWYSELDERFVLGVLDRIGERRLETRAAGASLHLYVLAAPATVARP